MNENVNVCITPKGDKPVLHFSQFDNERVFTVTVLADDGESAVDLTDLDIEFRLRKTDSHVVTIAPISVVSNVITFMTTEQLCACCGQNIASVVIMNNDSVISTLDILVDIQRDILSGGLTSESDIRNLTTQIEQIVPEVLGDDYYTKTEVDDLIDSIPTFDPTNYYDKSDVDTLLSAKADTDDLATVATTGDYDDLINKPTIPAAQVNSDWNAESGVAEILNKPALSTVATSGDYDDLLNKPVLLDQYVLDVDNKIKIIKTGNMVAVEIYANVAFNADGKTLASTIPEGFRTAYDMYFYAKIYDGSSYVDCMITFNTAGQIIVSNLFSGAITGANIFYLRNRSFVYYIE